MFWKINICIRQFSPSACVFLKTNKTPAIFTLSVICKVKSNFETLCYSDSFIFIGRIRILYRKMCNKELPGKTIVWLRFGEF